MKRLIVILLLLVPVLCQAQTMALTKKFTAGTGEFVVVDEDSFTTMRTKPIGWWVHNLQTSVDDTCMINLSGSQPTLANSVILLGQKAMWFGFPLRKISFSSDPAHSVSATVIYVFDVIP